MEVLQSRKEFLLEQGDRSDVDRRWKDIIAGLSKIHMVIGMDRLIRPFFSSQDFIGTVGNHLICVHMGGSPGARLKDIQHELFVPFSLHYLPRSLLDSLRDSFFQKAQLKIDLC